jgi:hypothetical protein
MISGAVDFRFLARYSCEGGAIFAERLGCLESEAARTAGDQPDAPRQVKQSRKRHTHGATLTFR